MAHFIRKVRVYTPADDDIPDRIKEQAAARELENYDMGDDADCVTDYLSEGAKAHGVSGLKLKTWEIGSCRGTDGVGFSADVDATVFIGSKFKNTVGPVPLDAFLACVDVSLYMRPGRGRHTSTLADFDVNIDSDTAEAWGVTVADLKTAFEFVETAWENYVDKLASEAERMLLAEYDRAGSWENARELAELNNYGWDEHGNIVSLDDCEQTDEPEPGDDSDPT